MAKGNCPECDRWKELFYFEAGEDEFYRLCKECGAQCGYSAPKDQAEAKACFDLKESKIKRKGKK